MTRTILIVKTSSLGDILQSFSVLPWLKQKYPNSQIDWVVKKGLHPIVEEHPLIHRAIVWDFNHSWQSIKNLRHTQYDLLFDLQGNTKSAWIVWWAKAETKIGFGWKTVREKLNLLVTHQKVDPSLKDNIRHQYLSIVGKAEKMLKQNSLDCSDAPIKKIIFKDTLRLMVCPGTRWENKKLAPKVFLELLQKIVAAYQSSIFFIWGSLEEKEESLFLQKHLGQGIVVERLSVPEWSRLMQSMDLVIAMDSSALHLAGALGVPSFSIFGPTHADIFRPLGAQHQSVQGSCPYGVHFIKLCPKLRTCATGACIKQIDSAALFNAFDQHVKSFVKSI